MKTSCDNMQNIHNFVGCVDWRTILKWMIKKWDGGS